MCSPPPSVYCCWPYSRRLRYEKAGKAMHPKKQARKYLEGLLELIDNDQAYITSVQFDAPPRLHKDFEGVTPEDEGERTLIIAFVDLTEEAKP